MTRLVVLGLIGIPGSGKVAARQRLCAEHGFRRMRFGDPLRDMLKAGFGVEVESESGESLTQPISHLNDYRPFHLMQKLGEWARRNISGDVLAQEWLRRMDGVEGLVVVDDIMDAREAAAIRQVGGVIVHVVRPNYDPPHRGRCEKRVEPIQSDLELINHSPDRLLALTDALANEVKNLCSGG